MELMSDSYFKIRNVHVQLLFVTEILSTCCFAVSGCLFSFSVYMYLCHIQMGFISPDFSRLEESPLVKGRHVCFLSLGLAKKIKPLQKAIYVTFPRRRWFGVTGTCAYRGRV